MEIFSFLGGTYALNSALAISRLCHSKTVFSFLGFEDRNQGCSLEHRDATVTTVGIGFNMETYPDLFYNIQLNYRIGALNL